MPAVLRPRRPNVFNTEANRPSDARAKCQFGYRKHNLPQYRQFQFPVEERAEVSKMKACCFNCFETGIPLPPTRKRRSVGRMTRRQNITTCCMLHHESSQEEDTPRRGDTTMSPKTKTSTRGAHFVY